MKEVNMGVSLGMRSMEIRMMQEGLQATQSMGNTLTLFGIMLSSSYGNGNSFLLPNRNQLGLGSGVIELQATLRSLA